MAQREIKEALHSMEAELSASGDTITSKETADGRAAAGRIADSSDDTLTNKSTETYDKPPAYFDDALKDAERLLKYAAETGIDIDADTRDHVLQARAASGLGWSKETATNLLEALTKLAVSLRPVTAESLRACDDDTSSTVREYWIVAVCLAIIIVPFSLLSFVSSAISSAIRTDIVTANELAVKLRAQLGPPAAQAEAAAPAVEKSAKPATQAPAGLSDIDVITELQQFASTIRAIDARARQLNVLVFNAERDPFAAIRKDQLRSTRRSSSPLGCQTFLLRRMTAQWFTRM